MKLAKLVILSLLTLFGLTAAAQTGQDTTDVVAYMQKGFGLTYKPTDDGMKCLVDTATVLVDTPAKKGPYSLNCRAFKGGNVVFFGWKPKTMEGTTLEKSLPYVIVTSIKQKFLKDKDLLECTTLPNDNKGVLRECKMTLVEQKVFSHFYVSTIDVGPAGDFILFVNDAFKGQQAAAKEMAFDYMSRLNRLDISASAPAPVAVAQ
jgi:hypothetical protein